MKTKSRLRLAAPGTRHNHRWNAARSLLIVIGLLMAMSVQGQKFPGAYVGYWKGDLHIYKGSTVTQTVKFGLEVFPADSGRYDWIITYGDSGQDRRHYTLVPIDTAKGHWAIDENNGIVIDMYATGNKMTSLFSVMGSVIQISYWLEGDEMVMELFSYPQKENAKSGKGTEESPEVNVWKFSGYQLGRMKRMKGMR
jgi:hypothetical protein